MIDVLNTIRAVEKDGQDVPIGEKVTLRVSNHWNNNTLVCVEFEGGVTLTVSAEELKAAIDNSTNTKRF